jgi:hypothetical protein
MIHIPATAVSLSKYVWSGCKYVVRRVRERKQTELLQDFHSNAGNMRRFPIGSKEYKRCEELAAMGRLQRLPFAGSFILTESVNGNAFRSAFGRR